jgi:hypothetical protein
LNIDKIGLGGGPSSFRYLERDLFSNNGAIVITKN